MAPHHALFPINKYFRGLEPMPKKKEPTDLPAADKADKAAAKAAKPAAKKPAAKASATADAPKPRAKKSAAAPAQAELPTLAQATPPAAPKVAPPAIPEAGSNPAAPPSEDATVLADPVTTIIIARFDVGHGNSLYIRGDGHLLSWDSGVALEYIGGDAWQWTTKEAREGVLAFKLLINDEVWSIGENFTAPFGETTSFYPAF